MSLKLLLILSGGLETFIGTLALVSPATVVAVLLGGSVGPIESVLVRVFGAGVFALGLACVKARHEAASPAGLAVSVGIASYNLLAATVLIWAAADLNLGGLLLTAAGIGHAVLGLLFVSALAGTRR